MSHTNSTTNYNLPQFLTTDKPFWLTDINGAFSDIDSAIYAAKSTADTAAGNAVQAISDAGAAATAASAADTKAGGAIASLADTFDATSTYYAGNKVMYNSLLYVCHTNVTTPGPWTGSDNWSRTTVEAVTDNLNSRVTSLESDIDDYIIYRDLTLCSNYVLLEGEEKADVTSDATLPQPDGYHIAGITDIRAQGYYGARVSCYVWIIGNRVHFSAYNPDQSHQPSFTLTCRIIYARNN